MLCGIKLGKLLCNKKGRLSLDFVMKKKTVNFFFVGGSYIKKNFYMQCSKQAHKILASSDEKKKPYSFFS